MEQELKEIDRAVRDKETDLDVLEEFRHRILDARYDTSRDCMK